MSRKPAATPTPDLLAPVAGTGQGEAGPTVDEVRRFQKSFRSWLEKRGAVVMKTAGREIVRFRDGPEVSILHRGAGDRLVATGTAEAAWRAFRSKAEWTARPTEGAAPAAPKPKRQRKSTAAAIAIRRGPDLPDGIERDPDGRLRIVKPGVYFDFPAADYHADPCPEWSLSNSGARLLVQTCPLIYRARRLVPPAPTRSLAFGVQAHSWILEGEQFLERYAILAPQHKNTTNVGREHVRRIEAGGKEPMRWQDLQTIKAMKGALEAHPWAMSALRGGRREVTIVWRDEDVGIWCRARLDFLPDVGAIVVDYMTARSIHDDDLERDIGRYGYDMKADWLRRAVKAAGLIEEPAIAYVVQEYDEPHAVDVVTVDEATMVDGFYLNNRACGLFARCMRTGEWPGYATDVRTVGGSTWRHRRVAQMIERGECDPQKILAGTAIEERPAHKKPEMLEEIVP